MPFLNENVYLKISGATATMELSSYVRGINPSRGVAELQAGTMGQSTDIKEPGLKSWSLQVGFLNSFATGADVDGFLNTLLENREKFTVSWRPTNAAQGASNPHFSGLGFITTLPSLGGGAHGTLAEPTMTIAAAGALSRSATATS